MSIYEITKAEFLESLFEPTDRAGEPDSDGSGVTVQLASPHTGADTYFGSEEEAEEFWDDSHDDLVQTLDRIATLRVRRNEQGALTERENIELGELINVLPEPHREIVQEKDSAGRDSHLFVHDSGDVILWETEEESHKDGGTGSGAIGRWQVPEPVAKHLRAVADE